MYDNKCDVIHETILKDVVDILMDLKDFDEVEFELGKHTSFKSIASASEKLTLIFPVVVSSDMDITSAMMVTKAIERKCVSMLQMLFSAFTITNAQDAIEYIGQFHTNMRMTDRMDMDSFIDQIDDLAHRIENESGPITVDKEQYDAIREDMKNNLNYYLDMNCINETSLNDYRILPASVYGKRVVVEAPHLIGWRDIRVDARNNVDQNRANNRNNRNNGIDTAYGSAGADVTKAKADFYSKQVLSSNDIKKANELMPTTMIINFITPGKKDGTEAIQTTAVIGVKAKMYPVSSMDIIDRIRSKNKDNNAFNMFIRATTREISFWKDFVFAIDKAKLDAISSSRRGSSSPIWKLLERRALKSRIRRNVRMVNDATAITTLVMSQNEVEWLAKNDNIDIMNPYVARSIMESYNLMGISIVDESIEVARFIFDTGDDDYESLTFSALERESSDTTYKRVVNLMTKMGR